FPLKDENGNVVNIIEYVKNISIQKKAEQLLKESEEKYRNIIESMGDPIHLIDRDLRIIYANLAFHKWLKDLNIDDKLEGKTVFEAFPFLPEKVSDEYLQVFNTGIAFITEETTKVKAEEIFTETRKIPIIKEEKVEQIITIIRNITERRIAEQKLRDSEIKYRELYSRNNLYKDLFTHDINNILQNILSSVELFSLRLNNQEISQKFDEILNLTKEQITRGSKLVKNVQKLSEIEDTKKPLISIEACEVLKKSIDFLRNTFYYKNLDVKFISTQNKFFVKGNDLLPNIFENILLNALKHNLNEKIEILIKISKIKKDMTDFIKFELIDNGIGIPDLLKKEIFSRKLHEIEKEKISSGMGLGLILVKSILNAINGEIAVEDRIKGDYAKGSNFIVLIPEAK
ncbi:MAG TPA: PAS domain-containing sensor histidine kinase, partial [Candidatus Lokiarchaeia archaeon]